MLKMVQFGQFLLLLFLLNSSSCFESEIAPVILDDTAKIRPTIDNYVITNVDYQPNDEPSERLDVLQDSSNIPTRSIASERSKKKRQIVNPLLKPDYLFFGNERYLVNINRDGTGVQGITTGTRNIISVDFDMRDSYIFWSDVGTRRIYRAKMDGTQVTTLVHTNIMTPDGIAWDWINKKLCWSDATERDIEIFDPSTGTRSRLAETGIQGESIPRAVVLDPFARLIYWTDWGSRPRIERMSYNLYDGPQREILHNTSLGWPNALSLDLYTQTLYWADALLDRIECSKSDGTGRRLLISQFIVHPFGIDFFKGTLYWTDWGLQAVLNSTIFHDTTQPRYTINGVITRLNNKPMGLRVVSLSKQPLVRPVLANECTIDCQNGGTCNQSVCMCTAGWSGSNCKNAANECTIDCQNGGTCNQSVCMCTAGWSGSNCKNAVCPDGCKNGGLCTSPGECNCSTGWSGTTCDQPLCNPDCGHHGSCTDPDVCTCTAGWTGEVCDKAICESKCENGGECEAPNTCKCTSQYYGPTCTKMMCGSIRCTHGKCNTPNECLCDPNWGGESCEKRLCTDDYCNGNGNCIGPNKCQCRDGWSGDTCDEKL